MMGLEGAILIPVLILASAVILYYGLAGTRRRQLEVREREGGWTGTPRERAARGELAHEGSGRAEPPPA